MGFFDSFRCNVQVFLRNQVFFPGNVVEGYVQIDVSSPIEFVAIRVKAAGKDKTEIVRRYPEPDGTERIERFFETTCVYKQLITLAGEMKSTNFRRVQILPPGHYTYPFAFQLPAFIPPSFNLRCGDGDTSHIQYYIKAYVDIPNGRDAVQKRWFTVLTALPQRQWIAREPMQVDRMWNVTFCCCVDKGKVSGRIFMDRSMIAIDRDNLVICADLDNSLGQEPIQSLEINLMHHLEYRACGRIENNRRNVGQTFLQQPIPPGGKGRVAGTIPIPRDAVPSVNSHNTTSKYTIKIELNIPWATDPYHEFPVVLAHSVDETNFLPPMQYNNCQFPAIRKGTPAPEFYYTPPPMPVFNYNPVPLQPPAQAQMIQYAPPQFAIAPAMDGTWSAPTAYNMTPQAQVTWQVGFAMQPMAHHQPPPPPPQYDAFGGGSQAAPAPLGANPNTPLIAQ